GRQPDGSLHVGPGRAPHRFAIGKTDFLLAHFDLPASGIKRFAVEAPVCHFEISFTGPLPLRIGNETAPAQVTARFSRKLQSHFFQGLESHAPDTSTESDIGREALLRRELQ